MAEERGKIEGDLDVADRLDLFGIVTGNLTVTGGGTAVIHGMVVRDLIVKPGGSAIVHGTISGDVLNEGGSLEIHGYVVGSLSAVEGTTMVAEDAVIHGERRP